MEHLKRNFVALLSVLFCVQVLLVCGISSKALAFDDSEYWPLDVYLRKFPEQALLMDRFAARVRAEPVKLNIKQARPLDIMVLYPAIQISDYWRRNIEAFEKRMKEIGIQYNLSFYLTKPGDAEFVTQSKIIEHTMTVQPDFLIFTMDVMRHQGLVNRILAQGKTKIILQNITTPVRSFGLRQPFLYVGFDHMIGTRILVSEYIRRFPDGAHYAIFYPEKGYVSTMRGDTFLYELLGQKNMELIESYYMPFNADKAYIAAMDLLQRHDDIDFIYATSTDIAHGIVRALKETGRLDDIVVNGWGGGASELEALEAGGIDFTVMRMNDDSAIAMAEAIRLYLMGRTYDVPTVYSGEFKLVDHQTRPEQLKKWKSHAFRYSN